MAYHTYSEAPRKAVDGDDVRKSAKGSGLTGIGKWSRKSLMLASSALTVIVFSLDLVTAEWTASTGCEMAFYALALALALVYVKFGGIGTAKPSMKQPAPGHGRQLHTGPQRQRQPTLKEAAYRNVNPQLREGSVNEIELPSSEVAFAKPQAQHAASKDQASAISQVLATSGPVAAGALLEKFEKEGWQSDTAAYNRVIRTFAKRGDLTRAEDWLTRLRARGLKADEDSYVGFISSFARGDDPRSAENWMKWMLENEVAPSTLSYGVLIDLHARLGDARKAREWFQSMTKAGLSPDTGHYNSLIHACSQRNDMESAGAILQEMRSKDLKASVKTYTNLVCICANSLDVKGAERWMQEMQESDIEPNVVSYSAMINACAKVGDLSRAERWYNYMQERGVQANAYSYSALINTCAQTGDVEAACSWLERAERAGTALDGVVYGCVVNACGKVGDAERAMEVFEKMKRRGIKSHIVVYGALARPFAYRGDWAEVERIRDMMLAEDGIKMNDYFLYTLLLSYSRAKPRESRRAEAEFRRAMEGGIAANDNLIKALSSAVGKVKCAQLVKELCPRLQKW